LQKNENFLKISPNCSFSKEVSSRDIDDYFILTGSIENAGSKHFLETMENALGTLPLLDSVWNASRFSFLDTYAKLSRERQGYLITAYVSVNQENPRENILFFDETSLGLPSKKMYYRAASEKTRKAYMALMKNLTSLLAEDLKAKLPDDLDQQLNDILEFESAIANVIHQK
jgi:predicted metalloendopeptidase